MNLLPTHLLTRCHKISCFFLSPSLNKFVDVDALDTEFVDKFKKWICWWIQMNANHSTTHVVAMDCLWLLLQGHQFHVDISYFMPLNKQLRLNSFLKSVIDGFKWIHWWIQINLLMNSNQFVDEFKLICWWNQINLLMNSNEFVDEF